MKETAILLSAEDIVRLKQILLDRDVDGAFELLREIHQRVQRSQNKSLNVGI